ncbi:hypothetical protein NM688_g7930 [Phlebia brevispora]|uniref:Uncharacterized protein n=1 Tax=Phlebia brevispora TaxID=194682 RepID=A0ACC1RZM2_9APHY|nr:hypothetical protein NM688_g7930 [Phlebia brevispora]
MLARGIPYAHCNRARTSMAPNTVAGNADQPSRLLVIRLGLPPEMMVRRTNGVSIHPIPQSLLPPVPYNSSFMHDLVRDSFIGQLIYYASGRRLLNYPEDRPDFVLPERYARASGMIVGTSPPSGESSETATLNDGRRVSKIVEKPEESTESSSDSQSAGNAEAQNSNEKQAKKDEEHLAVPAAQPDAEAGTSGHSLHRAQTREGHSLRRAITRDSRAGEGHSLNRPLTRESGYLHRAVTRESRLTGGHTIHRAVTRESMMEETMIGEEILRPPTRDIEKGGLEEERQRRLAEEEVNLNIVTWYSDDDPESPQNWSLLKKSFVTAAICILTFSIYIGASIFSPGIPDMSAKFHISDVAATFGLTMFVVGAGSHSPLQEPRRLYSLADAGGLRRLARACNWWRFDDRHLVAG